jgi:purine-nucleoside phosphorylase
MPDAVASLSRAVPAEPRNGLSAADAAVRFLEFGGSRGQLGVVLGTGLGELADRLDGVVAMPAVKTGFLPRSTATGHAGRIVSGRLGGVPVVMLQGRVHGYEGFSGGILTRGVDLLKQLGVRQLLLTNAAGGLDPTMRPGDIVVLHDHIDMVRVALDAGEATLNGEPRPGRHRGEVYSPDLVERAVAAASRQGFRCRSGVYVYVSGPTYETRAEYRMFRRIGGDVVGMSTVPEALRAHSLGIDVAAASVVTNVARPDAPSVTDAHDVCHAAAEASEGIWTILNALVAAS